MRIIVSNKKREQFNEFEQSDHAEKVAALKRANIQLKRQIESILSSKRY